MLSAQFFVSLVVIGVVVNTLLGAYGLPDLPRA